jgi:hypothetical protein
MGKRFFVLLSALFPWLLVGCHSVSRTAAPVPESQQIVSSEIKNLYMSVSAAAPHSPEQQELVRQMADRSTNAKELLLTMRAVDGVFSSDEAVAPVRATVTSKMMQVATLDQLSEYPSRFGVDPTQARAYVERMFQLASQVTDARAWRRVRLTAARLRQPDLERAAAARATP